jgi:hypothetical protein
VIEQQIRDAVDQRGSEGVDLGARGHGDCQSLLAVTLWFDLPYVMASGSEIRPHIDSRRTA